MPDGTAFNLDPEDEAPNFSDFDDVVEGEATETEEAEAPREEAAVEDKPPTEAPAEPEGEGTPEDLLSEAPEVEAPAEETPAAETPPEEVTYAGKYHSLEQFEAGYASMRRLQNDTAVRAAQAEDRAAALEVELQRILARAPQNEDTLETETNVEQIIDQRLAAERTRVQEALNDQQAITTFRSKHPDLSPEDETTVALIARDFKRIYELDSELLEIAFEASQDDDLHQVLRAQPQLIETPEGMGVARATAAQLRGQPASAPAATTAPPATPAAPTPAAPAAQPAPPTPTAPDPAANAAQEAAVKAARVETGNSAPSSPTTEGQPQDEWEEVLNLAKSEQGRQSPLGV